ncbi:MAG: hypothetical protein COW01_16360 [Bdellovibrionales bacterium CG12_big_fil_rev_8_21_14_0_65_38_15]|nr:MAG: hypothetical protein COW79_00550 [Bdellovibrionales bacterium CG22_combo_CG10-13_8_21_14_all_38_13]PIQ52276.1 MAG: hypothetical protein COW01_16360 [Bdellovibrionales bacterium CG12_big_fil_rev_8_21_14_0_65_38_15]PIR29805.1 MAG: hypothetical protein COV38_08825 [Bdellovibrionales bacterium CG11_big_fil_rev_8_21_14_0_20_38_13]
MNYLTLFILFISSSAFGFEQNITCPSFDECSFENNANAISFESESTKLGILTTSFGGRALSFKIQGKVNQVETKEVIVTIPVGGLSTDLSGRDDKMWNEILNKEKFPEIKLFFPTIEHEFSGIKTVKISILGQDHDLSVELTSTFNDGKVLVTGNGSFSLKELKIPDPSIAIASVRDRFDFKFKALIQ